MNILNACSFNRLSPLEGNLYALALIVSQEFELAVRFQFRRLHSAVDKGAPRHGPKDFGLMDFVRGDRKDIPVQQDQVRQSAGTDPAQAMP
jgi:hypothetical protein